MMEYWNIGMMGYWGMILHGCMAAGIHAAI
jgi:hypothetical protein